VPSQVRSAKVPRLILTPLETATESDDGYLSASEIAALRGFLSGWIRFVGVMSLQFAFRVAPQEVDACAATLEARGVAIVSPPTDQAFGHRTLFFRDPDGNVLEIYAEIASLAQRA